MDRNPQGNTQRMSTVSQMQRCKAWGQVADEGPIRDGRILEDHEPQTDTMLKPLRKGCLSLLRIPFLGYRLFLITCNHITYKTCL